MAIQGHLIKPKITGRVEITRSFSYKVNVGNYESRDFFCSQKAECAAEDADEIAEQVHQFCKRQVLQAVKAYQKEVEAQFGPQKERKTA